MQLCDELSNYYIFVAVELEKFCHFPSWRMMMILKKFINVYKPVNLANRTLSTSQCLHRLNKVHSVSHTKERYQDVLLPRKLKMYSLPVER